MFRINEVRVPLEHKKSDILKTLLGLVRINESDIATWEIHKKAIDARSRHNIIISYSINFELKNVAANKKLSDLNINNLKYFDKKPEYELPAKKISPKERPIVIGSGPCGIFCALILAECGLRPIIIEKGSSVEQRTLDVKNFWDKGILNPNSNIQFGEGGAGTFSDGKLGSQIKNEHSRCDKVLTELALAGAPKEILILNKPHVGTDYLKLVLKNLRQKITALGGEYLFETELTDLIVANGRITGIKTNKDLTLNSDFVVLATGHSARSTYKILKNAEVALTPKPFAVGLRIEHPQSLIDTSLYGQFAGHNELGSADYKVFEHLKNGRTVYSFCMCPGGEVIASSSEYEQVVTNGMSNFKRNSGNANSALLVNVDTPDFAGSNDDIFTGIKFQQALESLAFKVAGSNYGAPIQKLEDFLADKTSTSIGIVKPSYKPYTKLINLNDVLPSFISDSIKQAIPAFDKKVKGFMLADAILTGIETRSSSPIRILRNAQTLESENIKGLYPGGEGAGYAGGIMSSAVDGIKIAETIINSL